MPRKILRLPNVLDRTGLSRSTVYQRAAILNRFGHRNQFRRLKLCNGTRTEAGQNIGVRAPLDVLHMAQTLPNLPMRQSLGCLRMFLEGFLAERVGFEPTVLVKVHTLSKRAP